MLVGYCSKKNEACYTLARKSFESLCPAGCAGAWTWKKTVRNTFTSVYAQATRGMRHENVHFCVDAEKWAHYDITSALSGDAGCGNALTKAVTGGGIQDGTNGHG